MTLLHSLTNSIHFDKCTCRLTDTNLNPCFYNIDEWIKNNEYSALSLLSNIGAKYHTTNKHAMNRHIKH